MSGMRQKTAALAFSVLFCIASTVSGFSLAPKWRTSGSVSGRPYYQSSTTSVGVFFAESDNSGMEPPIEKNSLRASFRRWTGFSLTALRTTLRAATGISLTALYASSLAVSGAWIRQTMKVILSIFPAWARYFVQPFLVLYYVPLFILRSISAPQRNEGTKQHDAFIASWKQAVETADQSTSYWPLHINKKGEIENDISELDLNEGIAESVEVALEEQSKNAALL